MYQKFWSVTIWQVICQCTDYNIKFILLPPNSTHMCQPLDVAFFRPLKICWRQCLQEWKTKNKGTIPKSVFPRLLNQTLKKLEPAIAKNLQSGFRGTGIFPLNPEEVLKRLPGSTEHIAHRLSDSFEKYLREIRFESSTSKKRKRRLNVEAGKSVNETCFQARSDSDPASENGAETENNEVDREVNIQNALSTETMNLKVGDFIVGKYFIFSSIKEGSK